MGGTNFTDVALGRTPEDAYRAACEEARYMHGHGGYTGTIAEKSGFVQFDLKPRTDPFKVDRLIWDAEQALWYEQDPDSEWTHKPTAAQRNALKWLRERVTRVTPKPRPRGAFVGYSNPRPRDTVEHLFSVYGDKWGPAVCLEVTGQRATKIKEQHGRKGTRDKVYLFFGIASC